MEKTILILAANPKDMPRLRLEQEVSQIDKGLERARRREEFILKQKWATQPIDVRRAMLDFKPNIVHFCGHGGGEKGIAFEDETGHAKLVNAEALEGFFELFADKVECVVLNACYSEIQAEAIAHHINYVVGMSQSIKDAAAIEFAVAFYDALGAGESIEFAYKLACNAIQWTGIPGHLIPKLTAKQKGIRKRLVRNYMDNNVERFSLTGRERGVEYIERLRRGEEEAYTVVDEKEQKLRGVITPSDIRYKRPLYERDPNIEVERIMTENPYYVRDSDTLENAVNIMDSKNIITGLPVVDSHNRLVGYITRRQIMTVLEGYERER
jgi:predicted transcriptional regulator